MDTSAAQSYIDEMYGDEIIPQIVDYIRIPNKSPHFDADWEKHGYMEDAVQLIAGWCRKQPIPGMTLEIVRLEGRTPLIFMEIPGQSDDTILLYGHLDKQPEMVGWDADKGPWIPVMDGDRLYGRGGADDGYSAFASLTAIMACQRQQLPHARCVVIIEACEESGSYDLPPYIDHLKDRIGTPSLVVCLDSGAGNYDQLWMTTSLRGMAAGTLRADILTEGVHSGYASGIVPSSFRILRELIGRLEDSATGAIIPPGLHCPIPDQRLAQTRAVAELLGDEIYDAFPFVDGARPMGDDHVDALLNRNWRPALSITGVDGMPALHNAGNVLRPHTSLKLSLRLPPTLCGADGTRVLKETLESNPPYHAKVHFDTEKEATGWNAPELAPWLEVAAEKASQATFGASAMYMGEGGTIPFMGMLGEKFPEAQFLITGVLGPHSNAHGPNEFLHVPFVRKITTCVAQIIASHFDRAALSRAA